MDVAFFHYVARVTAGINVKRMLGGIARRVVDNELT